MMKIASVGHDLAKNVFEVHAVDASGRVVMRRQVRRAQMLLFFSRLDPCLIAIEACAGAHYWAQELARFDHQVRLQPVTIRHDARLRHGAKEGIPAAPIGPGQFRISALREVFWRLVWIHAEARI